MLAKARKNTYVYPLESNTVDAWTTYAKKQIVGKPAAYSLERIATLEARQENRSLTYSIPVSARRYFSNTCDVSQT